MCMTFAFQFLATLLRYIDKERINIFISGRRQGKYPADQYSDDGYVWAQLYQFLPARTS